MQGNYCSWRSTFILQPAGPRLRDPHPAHYTARSLPRSALQVPPFTIPIAIRSSWSNDSSISLSKNR